jgi:hypothetical protein
MQLFVRFALLLRMTLSPSHACLLMLLAAQVAAMLHLQRAKGLHCHSRQAAQWHGRITPLTGALESIFLPARTVSNNTRVGASTCQVTLCVLSDGQPQTGQIECMSA